MKKQLLIITLLVGGTQINADFHWHDLNPVHDYQHLKNKGEGDIHGVETAAQKGAATIAQDLKNAEAALKKGLAEYKANLKPILKAIKEATEILMKIKELQKISNVKAFLSLMSITTNTIPLSMALEEGDVSKIATGITETNTYTQRANNNIQKISTVKSLPAAKTLNDNAKKLQSIVTELQK